MPSPETSTAALGTTRAMPDPVATTGPDTSLRALPYPYRAMLAIASDLDETPDLGVYLESMRYLNTRGDTSMGPGVGLEVGVHLQPDDEPFAPDGFAVRRGVPHEAAGRSGQARTGWALVAMCWPARAGTSSRRRASTTRLDAIRGSMARPLMTCRCRPSPR